MMLSGKTALVTGAGRGIGKAIAQRLSAEGANVFLHYSQSADGAIALLNEITASGGHAHMIKADLSKVADVEEMLRILSEKCSSLDILVNNAGHTSGRLASLDETRLDEYENIFSLNARAVFLVTQGAVRLMKDGSRIINISSMATLQRFAGISAYAGSKAAVEAFTRIWSIELASRQITVNAVLPGMTKTELLTINLTPNQIAEMAQTIPLGRPGEPEDIAGSVAFLASDDAKWITGQNLVVNGGYC